MAERITGGQCAVYITAANTAATAILPAGLTVAMDSWDLNPTFTYEKHNEIGNPRTVSQQTEQQVKVTLNGGDSNGAALALAAGQSSGFLNKGSTPKYHVRITGSGTDGSFDRRAKWCVLDDVKETAPAGNKTITRGLTMTAEEIA